MGNGFYHSGCNYNFLWLEHWHHASNCEEAASAKKRHFRNGLPISFDLFAPLRTFLRQMVRVSTPPIFFPLILSLVGTIFVGKKYLRKVYSTGYNFRQDYN